MLAEEIKLRIQEILSQIGYDLARHPISTFFAVIAIILILIGTYQISRGETYGNEGRTNQGVRKAMLGIVIMIGVGFSTGLLDINQFLWWLT